MTWQLRDSSTKILRYSYVYIYSIFQTLFIFEIKIFFRFTHLTVTARATEKTLIMERTRPFSSRWLLTLKILSICLLVWKYFYLNCQIDYEFNSTIFITVTFNFRQSQITFVSGPYKVSKIKTSLKQAFQALVKFKKKWNLLFSFTTCLFSGLDSGLPRSCRSFSSTTDISGDQ